MRRADEPAVPFLLVPQNLSLSHPHSLDCPHHFVLPLQFRSPLRVLLVSSKMQPAAVVGGRTKSH